VIGAPHSLDLIRTALEAAGAEVRKSAARRVLCLIDELDNNDDVQDVYANFDIPDNLMESLAR
jgi:transcriptional/translational regulatory protein YebC/TACO1